MLAGRAGRGDEEADASAVGGGDAVKRRPVLPALTLGEWLLVDDPRTGLALAAWHDADLLHQRGDDAVAVRADGLALGGCLQQSLADARQPGVAFLPVEAEQVLARGRGQLAAQVRVVQEHRLLHERHDVARIRDLQVWFVPAHSSRASRSFVASR